MDDEQYCQDCMWPHPETTKRPSRLWLCSKFPRRANISRVVRGEWSADEPFKRCADINDRFRCPMFQPKETAHQAEDA